MQKLQRIVTFNTEQCIAVSTLPRFLSALTLCEIPHVRAVIRVFGFGHSCVLRHCDNVDDTISGAIRRLVQRIECDIFFDNKR
jgi:hypothetical protein